MITGSAKIKVRFAETDAMGVVYHANYLPWLECARLDLLKNAGISYEEIMAQGFHLPVVEVGVNYKSSARFNDEVEIRATIKSRPLVKTRIDYEVFARGKLLATAHTTHVFVNAEGIPVKPLRDFVEKLSKDFAK